MKNKILEITSPKEIITLTLSIDNQHPRLTNEEFKKIQREMGRLVSKIETRL